MPSSSWRSRRSDRAGRSGWAPAVAARSRSAASSSASISASATVMAAASLSACDSRSARSRGASWRAARRAARSLHLLEHLVLEVPLVALERLLVVLEGLELAGRGDRARRRAWRRPRRPWPRPMATSSSSRFWSRATSSRSAWTSLGLGVERGQLLALAGPGRPLGQRGAPVPQLLEVGVVLLEPAGADRGRSSVLTLPRERAVRRRRARARLRDRPVRAEPTDGGGAGGVGGRAVAWWSGRSPIFGAVWSWWCSGSPLPDDAPLRRWPTATSRNASRCRNGLPCPMHDLRRAQWLRAGRELDQGPLGVVPLVEGVPDQRRDRCRRSSPTPPKLRHRHLPVGDCPSTPRW